MEGEESWSLPAGCGPPGIASPASAAIFLEHPMMQQQQLREIEEKHEAGHYDGNIIEDLKDFVKRKRQLIGKDSGKLLNLENCNCNANQTLINAAIFLVIRRNGINAKNENMAQLEEMEIEKWIQNEKCPNVIPFEKIAEEWAAKHAADWRDHRIMTYCFLLQRESDIFLEILRRDENE
jgi:hypothetical protein